MLGGKMIKKTLAIILLSGLLVLPLNYCKKSDELSDAEVNEIFNTLCRVFNDALSQANASATAAVRSQAGTRRAADVIVYNVDWEGNDQFEGIWLRGSMTVDTDSGFYDGAYAFGIGLYDASSGLNKTVIINSGSGIMTFNGNAYAQILHSQNHQEFDMIIGTTPYKGVIDYELDAVGTQVTLEGTVVLNGKAYALTS